jgi:hypothetical protein
MVVEESLLRWSVVRRAYGLLENVVTMTARSLVKI